MAGHYKLILPYINSYCKIMINPYWQTMINPLLNDHDKPVLAEQKPYCWITDTFFSISLLPSFGRSQKSYCQNTVNPHWQIMISNYQQIMINITPIGIWHNCYWKIAPRWGTVCRPWVVLLLTCIKLGPDWHNWDFLS